MGVAYYANYYVWMEIGRVELVRSLGVNYHDMERTDGLLLSVAESQCRYIAPARYDEELAIATSILKVGSRLVEFGYEIKNVETGQTLARGNTKHMWVNREFKPTRLPEHYRQILQQSIEADA